MKFVWLYLSKFSRVFFWLYRRRGRIEVNKGIDCASRKIGLYWLDDLNGKESKTEFERLSYNGKTSVVYCKFLKIKPANNFKRV